MKKIPYELIDMVLLELDSLELALYLKRSWISKSIYQPYVNNMTIASYNGDLNMVKFIHKNGVRYLKGSKTMKALFSKFNRRLKHSLY
jgi:hypothetical protein